VWLYNKGYVVTYSLPIRRSITTQHWKRDDCDVMVAS